MMLKDMFDEISDADMMAALEESNKKPHKNYLNEGFIYSDDEVIDKLKKVAEYFNAEVSTGWYGTGINGDGWVIAYKDNSDMGSFKPPKIYFKKDGIVMGAEYDHDDEMLYSSKTSVDQIIDFIERNLNA